MRCLALLALVEMVSALSAGELSVDFSTAVGPVKPVNGVGQPPLQGYCDYSMFHFLREAGVPYARLHDVGGAYGKNIYVDIPNLFRDFDADENDPANYDFTFTDRMMKALVENGVEPYFRLGVTIENAYYVKAYRIHPPKDFAKWARICEHVIRHYTEGWADGFRMRITHWEIWNEPDSEEGLNPMWTGTFGQFCAFYEVVAKHLKAKFPHLMIGGYGSSGLFKLVQEIPRPHDEFTLAKFGEFVKYVVAHKCPLDFFSLHAYDMPGAPLTPSSMTTYVEYARQTLDRAGLTATEISLNEWLPRFQKAGSAKMSALIGGILIALQASSAADAEIYDARCGVGLYSPLFDPVAKTKLRKPYYVFLAFNELRKLGTAVKVVGSGGDLWAAAAKDRCDGRAVMVANVGERTLPLPDFFGGEKVRVRAVDAERNLEDVPFTGKIAGNTVLLIERPQGDIRLAVRGEGAAYAVVIPEKASECIRYAAAELQKYVKKLTGVKLEIRTDGQPLPAHAITLGEVKGIGSLFPRCARIETLSDEGFQLLASAPHLGVFGNTDRAVLYGVYDLLERFGGVRWYAPDCEVVPRLDALTLPYGTDVLERPAFAVRMPYWGETADGDYAARLRLNGNETGITGRHGGNPNLFDGIFRNCHSFARLVSPDEYFDRHPEYFSEVRGVRTRESSQLCLTNPDVLEIVTAKLLKRMHERPKVKYFGISQNDCYNNCTCAKCKAVDDAEGSPSGSLIRFVNAVAARVEKEFPDKVIQTLAYQYTQKPPKLTKPRSNVMPCLCAIHCDFASASRAAENWRFYGDLKAWRQCSKRLMVWDYGGAYAHRLMPFPNLKTLAESYCTFRECDVDYVFEEGAGAMWFAELSALKVWLCAKLMWNPSLPPDRLLDDFLPGYYGVAAPFVREYIDALQALSWHPKTSPLSVYVTYKTPVLTDEFLDRMDALWHRAETAVAGDPVLLRRVRHAASGVDYVRFMRATDRTVRDIMAARDTRRYSPTDRDRTLARRLDAVSRDAGSHPFHYCGNPAQDKAFRERLAKCLSEDPVPSADKAFFPAYKMRLFNRYDGAEYCSDPTGGARGTVVKIWREYHGRDSRLYLNTIGYDPGVAYQLCLDIRAPKATPDAKGEAFSFGVWDMEKKTDVVRRSVDVKDVKDGYAAYCLPAWRPTDSQYLWVSAGGAAGEKAPVSAVWVSQVGIIRAE